MVREDFLASHVKEIARNIAEALFECGCCSKCVLRFMGVKKVSYFSSTSSADKYVDELCDEVAAEEQRNGDCGVPLSKRRKVSLCSSCLGILTQLCEPLAVSQVVDIVKEANYDADTFLASLTIPTCLQLRQASILWYLKKKFSDVYQDKSLKDIPSVKEVWKWSFGPVAEKSLGKFFSFHSPLEIAVTITYEDDGNECDLLHELQPKQTKNKGKVHQWSRSNIEKLLETSPSETIERHFPCPPLEARSASKYDQITCTHAPIYLAGRYNKYSRQLSQTPWLIDGEKLMESSVQELIFAQIEPRVKLDEIVFSASGREDVDVRTLGRGRPFLLQLVNPRQSKFSKSELLSFQEAINSSTQEIAVRDLQVVSKGETSKLKMGEEERIKTYTALCVSKDPISALHLSKLDAIKELKLSQKTPIRVLHRRPAAVRERIVHEMSTEWIDDHNFKLKLTTQAGTYIKEFVHGDFGRTTPNLGTLLERETDILELDVESIELDWPPEL